MCILKVHHFLNIIKYLEYLTITDPPKWRVTGTVGFGNQMVYKLPNFKCVLLRNETKGFILR